MDTERVLSTKTHRASKLTAWEIMLLQDILEKAVDMRHSHARHLLEKIKHSRAIVLEIPKEMEE